MGSVGWQKRAYELDRVMDDLELAARTARAATTAERAAAAGGLVARLRALLEPQAHMDRGGLQAILVWLDALEHADPTDAERVQELLYGTDALVRVHVWRETGRTLKPPQPVEPLLR